MSLITRLVDLVTEGIDGHDRTDPDADKRLAVAALLVHVARVDGSMVASEHSRVVGLLSRRFGLSDDMATRLVERADALDRAVDDLAELIDMLGHGVPLDERHHLVSMAYAVAAADGRFEEFEEDLVWRVAHLLGLDEAAIAALKERALQGATGAMV